MEEDMEEGVDMGKEGGVGKEGCVARGEVDTGNENGT